MKIPPIYFVYFGAALLVGLIFSFGVVGIFHQPVPLQVQLEQYKPAQPPAPAIPTIAPSNPAPDKFAPAPPPVVVTTAPLPTITPSPTQSVGKCDVSAGSDATSFACITEETIEPIITGLTLVGTMLIILGVMMLLLCVYGFGRFWWEEVMVSRLVCGIMLILVGSTTLLFSALVGSFSI